MKFPTYGPVVEWLQFHPVTVRGTGSNPVGTAKIAEVAHLVEHRPSKSGVASSSLVFRSKWIKRVVTTGVISITTLLGGSSSFGRAQPCQGWGGQFETGLPLIRPP